VIGMALNEQLKEAIHCKSERHCSEVNSRGFAVFCRMRNCCIRILIELSKGRILWGDGEGGCFYKKATESNILYLSNTFGKDWVKKFLLTKKVGDVHGKRKEEKK